MQAWMLSAAGRSERAVLEVAVLAFQSVIALAAEMPTVSNAGTSFCTHLYMYWCAVLL